MKSEHGRITNRRMYVVKVATSTFKFTSLDAAVKKMIEFSKNDKLKYIIYKVNQLKVIHTPKRILFKGKEYKEKHWRGIGYWKFINSLF